MNKNVLYLENNGQNNKYLVISEKHTKMRKNSYFFSLVTACRQGWKIQRRENRLSPVFEVKVTANFLCGVLMDAPVALQNWLLRMLSFEGRISFE